MRGLDALVLLSLLYWAALGAAQRSGGSSKSTWLTLNGGRPTITACGGLSGLLPDSSYAAYNLALMTSVPDLVVWCDVQLTKDGVGICFPGLKLENASNIAQVYTNMSKTHVVNRRPMNGYFTVDFTKEALDNVSLTQGVYSRSDRFDGSLFAIMTVEEVAKMKPSGLWLNIQDDAFYNQFNLSMRSYLLSIARRVVVNYISSPDLGFLQSISQRFSRRVTKLFLQFLGPDEVEPSTKMTYGSLLQNLTLVKTTVSGVLVDKSYIWPKDNNEYLQAHTSVVADAHKVGLEVFASNFANDIPYSYNFSYDPVLEYLQFIDNGRFSVDGVLSAFPITASEAVDCFSHIDRNASAQAGPLVISLNGASGYYPGGTDDAYNKAILDGADIIDCTVQMSKDDVTFCVGSINLLECTNAAQTSFVSLLSTVPEINMDSGLATFSLTWKQIEQNLKPQIFNPYAKTYHLDRNPINLNSGKLLKLSDFLALANNSSVSGVLIKVENAAYLAEKQNKDVISAVFAALRDVGYLNQTAKKVMIMSSNSSVLNKFKDKGKFELVYNIDEVIGGALNSAIEDIKNFAHSAVISKSSVFPTSELFTVGATDVVQRLHSHNLSVYVRRFDNEFVSQAWDFFSDPYVELNSFVVGTGIDGVITSYPETAASYKRNKCLGLGNNTPVYMTPVQPGALLQLIAPLYLPPAESPKPVLDAEDVVEPPLSPFVAKPPSSSTNSTARAPTLPRSGQPKIAASLLLSGLLIPLATFFLF